MSADVFVDRTGRRRRVLTWLAVVSAAVLVGALGLLAAGVFTGGPLTVPGWSGTGAGGATHRPGSAVIGPAPQPAPPPSPRPAPPSPAAPGPTTSPAPTSASAASTHPGRGLGRSNKPTAKPDHPRAKDR